MKLFIRAHDLGQKSLAGIIEKLNTYQLDGVQMVAYKCLEDVQYTVGGIDDQKAKQIAKAFLENQKTIPLIGAYFNPVHSNAEKVELGKNVFRDYLSVAKAMGANLVGSETGSFNDDKWTYHPKNRTDEALKQVVDCFGELAKFAQEKGVNIAIEGAFGHVCYDVKRLKLAIDSINQPNVKVIFDLYNYLASQNANSWREILLEGLETFKNQIEIFHLKDFVVLDDGQLKQVSVGKGVLDYDFILGEISKLNPNANLVLEGTVEPDIEQTVKFLKNKYNK